MNYSHHISNHIGSRAIDEVFKKAQAYAAHEGVREALTRAVGAWHERTEIDCSPMPAKTLWMARHALTTGNDPCYQATMVEIADLLEKIEIKRVPLVLKG